jgi:hypothetical protein
MMGLLSVKGSGWDKDRNATLVNGRTARISQVGMKGSSTLSLPQQSPSRKRDQTI